MKKVMKTIKDTLSIFSSSKGFSLLELLVVVLIIGILASIALPQYKMAVTKSKVASILPLMRRWKDALMEYKLQHGDYGDASVGDILGVNWPSDWECSQSVECRNDYWGCTGNDNEGGRVYCNHNIDANNHFLIMMYQFDDEDYENLRGMMTCEATGNEGEKVCKALGGQLLEDIESDFASTVYKLN